MILIYHKISFNKNDNITVDLFSFLKQMFSLKKYNVVYLKDYDPDNEKHIVLRFDDGYKSVLKYAAPILKCFNYPFEVFIIEEFYNRAENGGKKLLNKSDLQKILKCGGRLQYHTKTHPHLDEITDTAKLKEELICPDYIKELDQNGFEYLAYPFWKYNEQIIEIVKKYYKGACSGNGFAQNTVYSLDSIKVDAQTEFPFRHNTKD